MAQELPPNTTHDAHHIARTSTTFTDEGINQINSLGGNFYWRSSRRHQLLNSWNIGVTLNVIQYESNHSEYTTRLLIRDVNLLNVIPDVVPEKLAGKVISDEFTGTFSTKCSQDTLKKFLELKFSFPWQVIIHLTQHLLYCLSKL